MNKKLLLTIATALGITAAATNAVAAPLPAGTRLTIAKTTDPEGLVPCTNGSCFGMYLMPGLFYWTPIGPGTDGGLIIGKAQTSGGQEVNGLSTNNGELTAVWNYGANWGTFFTAPSDASNVFDDASCAGSGCGSNTTPRKTDLAVWNTAWGGQTIPMGSASGCNKTLLPACTADEVAGIFVKTWTIDRIARTWRLTYNQVVPTTFPNFPFELILSGPIVSCHCGIPIVTVSPAMLTGDFSAPISFTITATDTDGDPLVCRIGTPPANGTVTLAGCISGTYRAGTGFFGSDSFTIIANDSMLDSAPFTVLVGEARPTAGNINISGDYGVSLPWTPVVTYASTCRIGTPANNGAVALASDCSHGFYTADIGFVGTDSFTYIASNGIGDSLPATVTAAITAPTTDTGCAAQYPVKQVTVTGKQGHLTMTVTGNIISVNPNGKEIKICPTTTASYNASTNTPGATVVCRVKSNTSRGHGDVKVNDHVKCTDKPAGNDKLGVKIKSGMNQNVM